MTFRLAPEYQIQETNFEKGHKEYRVICTLKSIASGTFVGQGVGCCSTLESKYRWKGGARKCPECGKEAIIKGKAEYGGGWLCFAKKGGCGAKWVDGAREIEGQSVDKVENDSPADFFNTVLKMAKKRAFVDATITATAASDIFTQDIGDEESDEAPKSPQDAPGPARAQSPAPPVKTPASPKPAPAPKATATPAKKDNQAAWDAFLAKCKARLLELVDPEYEWAWWGYAVDKSWILPSLESLADARAEKIFAGLNRKDPKTHIKTIVNEHCVAVEARAKNCSVELRDEMLRGMTPMPLAPGIAPAPTEQANPFACPHCKSTATQKHDDYEEVTWCQKCGWQWDGAGAVFESHPFMQAKLPFAPKDEDKKQFKGMTLGQISRLDNKYWYGVVKNFEAKPWQGHPPSAESVKFAEVCKEARQYLEEQKKQPRGDKPELDDDGPTSDQGDFVVKDDDDLSDVPF
jgi:ssDNA-binding Zn-finger/Zn-ribbon topoisomerase 1